MLEPWESDYAVFQITQPEARRYLSSAFMQNVLRSGRWDICDRSFKDHRMREVFSRMTLCKATIIYLDYNKLSNIIRFIQRPLFPQLQEVFLGDNSIFSIEALNRLSFPNLQVLHLNDNHITELKSLRKCCIPQLTTLSVRENKLPSDFHLLWSIQTLDSKNLNSILVSYNKNPDLLALKQLNSREGLMIGVMAMTNWRICWNQVNFHGIQQERKVRL